MPENSGAETQAANPADTSTRDGNSADTQTDSGNSRGNGVAKPSIEDIVRGRVERARAKFETQLEQARAEERERLLADLDVDDADELRERLGKLRESESEAAKLARRLTRAEKERDALQAKLSELDKAQRESAIDRAIIDALGDNAYHKPALALLRYNGGLDIDDDGKVTANGTPIDKAVKALLADHAELVRGDMDRGGSGSQEAATTPAPPTPATPQTTEQRIAAAQAAGLSKLYSFEK